MAGSVDIIISASSSDPIYQQIANQVKAAILAGELEAAEPLPSIRSLARDLRVSVITTKRAYSELEADGFIETVPGKGSFVAGENQELLREKRLRVLEEHISEVIAQSRLLDLTLDELVALVHLLYEEEQ